jgi:hypothetical protein
MQDCLKDRTQENHSTTKPPKEGKAEAKAAALAGSWMQRVGSAKSARSQEAAAEAAAAKQGVNGNDIERANVYSG